MESHRILRSVITKHRPQFAGTGSRELTRLPKPYFHCPAIASEVLQMGMLSAPHSTAFLGISSFLPLDALFFHYSLYYVVKFFQARILFDDLSDTGFTASWQFFLCFLAQIGEEISLIEVMFSSQSVFVIRWLCPATIGGSISLINGEGARHHNWHFLVHILIVMTILLRMDYV